MSGNAYIEDTILNTSSSYAVYSYSSWASLDGCESDTSNFSIYIQPQPSADFSANPSPVITANQVTLSNTSNFPLGNGSILYWDLGDGTISTDDSPIHSYSEPGSYTVCLFVEDEAQCPDSICKQVSVVPAEVNIPNVVTPNNDGVNDLLIFNYLEYYPDNELFIFNRWGNPVYHAKNYNNDWNGINHTEGTYYFKLVVNDIGETYSGFFQLVKD